jgi:N-acetylmuramoyl-L-alanine amidase
MRSTYILIGLICLACSPYYKTNRLYKRQARQLANQIKKTEGPNWVGTTNFGLRKPNFVVIHHTAQNSCEQTLRTFTISKTQVSAHYVICREGKVHQMLNDYMRAWHAGSGSWGKLTDVNSASIGIELDNNGHEAFSDAQMNALMALCKTLKQKHSIPAANFIGHADIAPGRKNDPSVLFDWHEMAKNGFGKWYGDTSNLKVPEGLNLKIGLDLLGYATKDTTAALITFKRKYLKKEDSVPLNSGEYKILWSLINQ